ERDRLGHEGGSACLLGRCDENVSAQPARLVDTEELERNPCLLGREVGHLVDDDIGLESDEPLSESWVVEIAHNSLGTGGFERRSLVGPTREARHVVSGGDELGYQWGAYGA